MTSWRRRSTFGRNGRSFRPTETGSLAHLNNNFTPGGRPNSAIEIVEPLFWKEVIIDWIPPEIDILFDQLSVRH
jgi:hypothetical protein